MASSRQIARSLDTEISGGSDGCDEGYLLRRLASGDSEAFWTLWARHRSALFQICLAQMAWRREDAEDALSDVMARARECLPGEADKVRSLTAWLRRVTVNVCIDLHRRNKRRACVEYVTGGRLSDPISQPLQFPSQASQHLASEIRRVVKRAIEALPERLRAAAGLFLLEEASYAAIADALAISEANARKRIQEARRILQEMLDVEFPERREAGIARSSVPRTVPAASLAAQIRKSPRVAAQRKQLSAAFGGRGEEKD